MFMPRQEGPPIVMDEISRTYYPGRGFLTDQQAYPITPSPRYSGGDPNLGNTGAFMKLPYFPGQETGGVMNLPYFPGADMNDIELLAGGFRSGAYSAIPGGQSFYRYGPYLPFRGEEKKEEQTPFIPIPRV